MTFSESFQREVQRIGHALDGLAGHHAVVDGVLERALRGLHQVHGVVDQAAGDQQRNHHQRVQLEGQADVLERIEAHDVNRQLLLFTKLSGRRRERER
jgi:hypothetical protein